MSDFVPSQRKRWWRCDRKQPLTEQQAVDMAKRLRENKRQRHDWRMTAYKCYYGDHWHIGHAPRDSRFVRELQGAQSNQN